MIYCSITPNLFIYLLSFASIYYSRYRQRRRRGWSLGVSRSKVGKHSSCPPTIGWSNNKQKIIHRSSWLSEEEFLRLRFDNYDMPTTHWTWTANELSSVQYVKIITQEEEAAEYAAPNELQRACRKGSQSAVNCRIIASRRLLFRSRLTPISDGVCRGWRL